MNHFSGLNKKVNTFTVILLVFSVCALIGVMLPVAKAQLGIQLSPTQGPPGIGVDVFGFGFTGGVVTITFGSQQVSTAYPESFGRIDTVFSVPQVSPGDYTVTATTSSGSTITATFVVTTQVSTGNTGSTGSTGSAGSTGSTGSTSSTTGVSASISLSSDLGTVGTRVTVAGSGFVAGSLVTVNFDTTYVASTTADSSGNINVQFSVPIVVAGAHTVSATTTAGAFAEQSFVVGSGTSRTTPSSNVGTQPGTTVSGNSGEAWTIAAIVLVAAAVVIVPVTFISLRRSGKGPVVEQEPPLVTPGPSYPSSYPSSRPPAPSTYAKPGSVASRYDQFASYGKSSGYQQPLQRSPSAGVRYGQPASYRGTSAYNQPTSYRSASAYNQQTYRPSVSSQPVSQPQRYASQSETKTVICRHCKRSVREDYNVCPYCRKRLR